MTFEEPELLALLVVPAALVAWELLRRSGVPMPFDHAEHRRGWRDRFLAGLLRAASLLPALLAAVAIVALAGPQKLGKPTEKRKLTNIEFVVDISCSMEAEVAPGVNRFQAAMRAVQKFTELREGDAFGLTIFGNEHLRWMPLTRDTAALYDAGRLLDPRKMPGAFGGTEIGAAVKFCQSRLNAEATGDKTIIVVSDGISFDLQGGKGRALANALKRDGITCFAIMIGDDGMMGLELLEGITRPTGGATFSAVNEASMAQVFRHIDAMQPVEREPTQRTPIPWYAIVAFIGLPLLGLHTLASLGLRYTPW